MDTARNTRGYDLFKLIVALILLALLIIMLLTLRPPGTTPTTTSPATQTAAAGEVIAPVEGATPIEPEEVALQPTEAAQPTETTAAAVVQIATEPPPQPTATATQAPTPTEEPVAPTAEPAALEPTATPAQPAEEAEATPTPAAAESAGGVDCPLALPPRLAVGDQARVMSNLNLRSDPGLESSLVRTHRVGTVLEVIGGPVCGTFDGGAYLWWEVRLPDGTTGWSAEGSSRANFYFLQAQP